MNIKKRFELDQKRLATTDPLGERVYLYPEDVDGPWKKKRFIFYWFLILLYLIFPWINVGGKPALMINIFTQKFTFLGHTLHNVEPIILFLLIISGLFFVALVTGLWGRVWCGWACPQTVFIHTIFLKIETLIEGGARQRKELDQTAWNLKKITKKSFKWFLFTLVSLHISHTLIGYIIGPRQVFLITIQNPLNNLGLFTMMIFLTAIFLFDFGWFKEQFCIIACPYGRMQSVIMDKDSLVIAYDQKRGEPRRGSTTVSNEGDCINCYACVKVCPTGIDIRRGTQLECIACTNCIDACDDIMTKINKPKGLIRFSTESKILGIESSKKLKPRSIIYFIILLFFISAFFYFISTLKKPSLFFIRGENAPYLAHHQPGEINYLTNHFILRISHQEDEDFFLKLELADKSLSKKIELITPLNDLKITNHQTKTVVFFKFSPTILDHGSKMIKLNIIKNNVVIDSAEVTLVGPIL